MYVNRDQVCRGVQLQQIGYFYQVFLTCMVILFSELKSILGFIINRHNRNKIYYVYGTLFMVDLEEKLK